MQGQEPCLPAIMQARLTVWLTQLGYYDRLEIVIPKAVCVATCECKYRPLNVVDPPQYVLVVYTVGWLAGGVG